MTCRQEHGLHGHRDLGSAPGPSPIAVWPWRSGKSLSSPIMGAEDNDGIPLLSLFGGFNDTKASSKYLIHVA